MTKVSKIAKNDIVTLRDRANAFAQDAVDAMCAKIAKAFAQRDKFESGAMLSYLREKERMLVTNKIAVARLFLALDIEPSNVILRKVSSNAMFNAKAFKKICELASFVCTGNTKIEKVMSAFIACALLFDERTAKGAAISNAANKAFLSNMKFDQIVQDVDLAAYLADYQHKFITGGKDTQSSQARNVLDVLGLGAIATADNRARGGVIINSQHEFYSLFRESFMKAA